MDADDVNVRWGWKGHYQSNPTQMIKYIGIVGCSAEGAALCYKTICHEASALLGKYAHPEVSMHTHSLADYEERLGRADFQGVGALMLSSARKLARAGADFLICPDNTIHQALPIIEKQLPLPWLHIASVVAQEARQRGFRKLGIIGTKWLVDSEVYPSRLSIEGIECLRPSEKDRQEMSDVIMSELVLGVFDQRAVAGFQRVITTFRDQGCDGVVLGCTEIPLIIDDNNSPLPTFDSTRLLARASLKHAISALV